MIRRPDSQRGFTLIELMISLALIAFMTLVAWSTVSGTAGTKKSAESLQQRNHEIRVAMMRMVADLSTAYLSDNEVSNQPDPRTLFVGKDGGAVNDLRFSALAHHVLWADANESEQTLVYYYSESDPDDPGQTNLLRRESRRLSDENWKDEPAEVDVLLSDVDKVDFEYWDFKDKDWKKRWDSTASDGQRNRLPTRVRITVEVKRGDRTMKYSTQARIMRQEVFKVVL